jgi:hypothetical protein
MMGAVAGSEGALPDMDGEHFRENVVDEFRRLKELAERAIAQVSDEELFRLDRPDENSIAIIVKHIAGNLRSRWTRFLTTDGEKPDRDRDAEFVIVGGETRADLMDGWETGWGILFAAIRPLTDADLGAMVRIRGEAHTVVQAIHRQLAHYAYHVGQIVLLARHWAGPRWRALSIPRGGSSAFNAAPDRYVGRRDARL